MSPSRPREGLGDGVEMDMPRARIFPSPAPSPTREGSAGGTGRALSKSHLLR